MNAYEKPQITEYGTLVGLTASATLDVAATLSKSFVVAAVSVPIGGGNGSGSGNDVVVAGSSGSSGVPVTPSGTSTTTAPALTTPTGASTPSGGDLGEVLPRTETGSTGTDPSLTTVAGDGSAGGSSGSGGAAGGGDGRLPFTGFAVMLTAGVGAALTSAGVTLRQRLRRS